MYGKESFYGKHRYTGKLQKYLQYLLACSRNNARESMHSLQEFPRYQKEMDLMDLRRVVRAAPKSLLFLSLSLLLFAACSSNTSAGSSSSASATATACVQATRPASALKTAVGTLRSMSGQTLVIANMQGKNVTITYSGSTHFSQEVSMAATDLKEGTPVRVEVTSSGNTYSATSITVTSGTGTTTGRNNGSGFGGFPGANGTPGTKRGTGTNPCFANRGRFGKATPGTSSFRGLTGTVSQLNGNTLTVSDTSGTAYIVTITPQTQIVETKSVTAAALKIGQALTVSGTANKQGAIAANQVAILLKLPTRTPPPTA